MSSSLLDLTFPHANNSPGGSGATIPAVATVGSSTAMTDVYGNFWGTDSNGELVYVSPGSKPNDPTVAFSSTLPNNQYMSIYLPTQIPYYANTNLVLRYNGDAYHNYTFILLAIPNSSSLFNVQLQFNSNNSYLANKAINNIPLPSGSQGIVVTFQVNGANPTTLTATLKDLNGNILQGTTDDGSGNQVSSPVSHVLQDSSAGQMTSGSARFSRSQSDPGNIPTMTRVILGDSTASAPPSLIPSGVTSDGVSITIPVSLQNGTGTAPISYQWYRSSVQGYNYSSSTLLAGKTSLTLNDTPPSVGPWYYRLVATDANNLTGVSPEIPATIWDVPACVIFGPGDSTDGTGYDDYYTLTYTGTPTSGGIVIQSSIGNTSSIAGQPTAANIQAALDAVELSAWSVSGTYPAFQIFYSGWYRYQANNPILTISSTLSGGSAAITHTQLGVPPAIGQAIPPNVMDNVSRMIRPRQLTWRVISVPGAATRDFVPGTGVYWPEFSNTLNHAVTRFGASNIILSARIGINDGNLDTAKANMNAIISYINAHYSGVRLILNGQNYTVSPGEADFAVAWAALQDAMCNGTTVIKGDRTEFLQTLNRATETGDQGVLKDGTHPGAAGVILFGNTQSVAIANALNGVSSNTGNTVNLYKILSVFPYAIDPEAWVRSGGISQDDANQIISAYNSYRLSQSDRIHEQSVTTAR